LGTSNTGTAALNFNFANTASTIRQFEIKITQIPCASSSRPPSGCFQYHTGLTGRIETFNFQDSATPLHLQNQNYDICIRGEEGYCCVRYKPCSDANSYTLDALDTAVMSMSGSLCNNDYLAISGVSESCDPSSTAVKGTKLCGNLFHAIAPVEIKADGSKASELASVCDCTKPFTIQVVTDGAMDSGVAAEAAKVMRGACLEYMQIPC